MNNNGMMGSIEQIELAIRDISKLRELDNETGRLFASIIVFDVDTMEKRFLDALNIAKKWEEEGKDMTGIHLGAMERKIAFLQCLQSFRDDLLQKYPPAQKTKKEYEESKLRG